MPNKPITHAAAKTFTLVTSQKIASLNIEYQEFQHSHTKAKHIHLASEHDENVFMVALRTVPTDSTGVAHILEHTSLCGSKRYPVRDPFFMMIRRSLNTFMNAFTSSDWTAYPFASQNKKDFNNLLSVYLDAVFFARLDELDFAQEGHRLEFAEANNPESELVYKGVVFNEMKGAMSSVPSQLWQAISGALFPDTTYGHNSGGEPSRIPDLTYQQLKSFYQTHYHPDNAVFITFGNIPAIEHQEQFEALALSQFKPLDLHIEVPLQKAFDTPITQHTAYAVEADQAENKTHRVMAWVLGDIRNPLDVMTAQLLNSILFENSASPLQKALETSPLGSAPSPLCGMDDSSLQMVFACGLEGCAEDSEQAFEQLVIETLQDVASAGVPYERLSALLDQLELQQREISGDGYPYGLQLMLACLPSAMHRGNPAAALDLDPVLTSLRNSIRDPDFVKTLVNRLLLNNKHRVTLALTPDTELNAKKIAAEAEKLAAIKMQLSEQEKQHIVSLSAALLERQAKVDDPEILPKVDLNDVPKDVHFPAFSTDTVNQQSYTFYPQGTNGLTYRQVVTSLPQLSEQEHLLLPVYDRIKTEVGVGDKDYLDTQDWQTAVCGGISSYSTMRSASDDVQQVSGYHILSSKGLATRSDDIDQLTYDTFFNARFDEQQRLAELISQSAARAEQSVTGNGHRLAIGIACQGMSPLSRLSHATSGVLGIQRIKQLAADLASKKANSLGEQLADLHQKIVAQPRQFLAIDDAGNQANIKKSLATIWREQAQTEPASLVMPSVRENSRELWVCNSQVNFCAKAYPTVPMSHPDAAALTVLAGVLRNGFLHTAIREQGGAYGGGAGHDTASASFRFYSYRDPRLLDTLNDFDRSIDWLLNTEHPWRTVEEAILGVIGTLDKPASPAGTAKQDFHNRLFKLTHEQQIAFRNSVLAVTQADLKRVAETYLKPDSASIGVISHSGESKQQQQLERDYQVTIKKL